MFFSDDCKFAFFFCIFVELTTLWSVVINLTAGFA